MKLAKNVLLWIIGLALILRLIPFDFPFFTADEARIAFRGYTLSTKGTDELGRKFPLIFNSLEDYQLPMVSYLTSLGTFVFGKSDLGARSIFILLGAMMVFLVYKIAEEFSEKKIALLSAFFIASSPVLIFLSRVPNETIVLTFFVALIFFILIRKKLNLALLLIVIVLSFFTSKMAWFVIPPFAILTTVFFQRKLPNNVRSGIFLFCLITLFVALAIFLSIPQGKRSLMENNFPIFQDTTIKSAIDRLRGQGLESGWPPLLERLLLNKAYIVVVGVLHWASSVQPATLFGQFDATGLKGLMSMGAFPKVAIIPFALGLVFLIQKERDKFLPLAWYILFLSFPVVFLYPQEGKDYVVLTLPFLSIVMAWGLNRLNKFLRYSIITLVIFEVLINLFSPSLDVKNASYIRPGWIQEIANESFKLSLNDRVAISDDLVSDLAPFLQLYTPIKVEAHFSNMHFPYKFRQTKLSNIKIIGSEDTFYKCGLDKPTYIIASKRDLAKIQKWLNIVTSKTVNKVYQDSLGQDVAYLLAPIICVK